MRETYFDKGQIKLVYRHYIIFGSLSRLNALGAECAGEQDAFWEFHDEIYRYGSLNDTGMYQTAGRMRLDVDKFTECVEEQRYADIVEADIAFAKALEVSAVPTFLWEVDDQWTMMVGVKENFIDLVNEFIWRGADN